MRSIFTLILFATLSKASFSQTTAMNFNGNDCNGNAVNIFSDLDAGKAVVLFYYMPNCSTCIPPANAIQKMANKINSACPGMVKGYANSYLNSTTCVYTASWVTSNNLTFYTPIGGTGADEVAYYGGFGMPTVVLLGGTNHDVIWSTQNWQNSDTTIMRDYILAMNCSVGLEENQDGQSFNVYPNPSYDQAEVSFNMIQSQSYSIAMFDVVGKLVYQSSELAAENGAVKRTIDVSNLPEGSYTVEVNINGVRTNRRLVVKH